MTTFAFRDGVKAAFVPALAFRKTLPLLLKILRPLPVDRSLDPVPKYATCPDSISIPLATSTIKLLAMVAIKLPTLFALSLMLPVFLLIRLPLPVDRSLNPVQKYACPKSSLPAAMSIFRSTSATNDTEFIVSWVSPASVNLMPLPVVRSSSPVPT